MSKLWTLIKSMLRIKHMSEYETQANNFLAETKTSFNVEFLRNGLYFDDDKDKRDIYNITFKRGEREYKFKFGQSIAESGFKVVQTKTNHCLNNLAALKDLAQCKDKREAIQKVNNALSLHSITIYDRVKPTPYDVLACLTKYDCGTFENFCSEFGYDTDSRKAEKTYKAVCDEWINIQRLFTDEEIEDLREIQ